MRLSIILAGLFLLLGGFLSQPSHALSCAQPEPLMSYSGMTSSENNDVIAVRGTLVFEGKFAATRQGGPVSPSDVQKTLKGHISGKNLKNGESFDSEIRMEQHCISSWCGYIEPAHDSLFLLNKIDDEYVLALNPCGGSVFRGDDSTDLKNCLQNNDCNVIGEKK